MRLVKLPDGSRASFPDDATDEEIDAAVNQNVAPKAIPTVDGSPMKTLGKMARPFVQAIPSAVFGLPAMAADAYDSAVNLTRMGVNRFRDKQIPLRPPFAYSGAMSEAGKQMADRLGLPGPETDTERGLTDIATTGAAALGGAGLANIMGRAIPSAAGGLSSGLANAPRLAQYAKSGLREMASGPGIQTAGAVGGAAATDAARDIELSPGASMAVGAIGSIAAGGGASGAVRVPGAVKGMIDPLTAGGKELIVGRTLREMATQPSVAQERLANASEIIEGSKPTIAQAGKDPGLIAAEVGAKAFDQTNRLGARASEQNQARMAALDDLAGDDARLASAKAYKAKIFESEAEPAFANRQPVMQNGKPLGRQWIDNPVLRAIRDVRDDPLNGGVENVKKAMDQAEQYIVDHPNDLSDPRALYAARRNVNDFMDAEIEAGIRAGDGGKVAAAMKLKPIVAKMDELIETGSPGYKKYMELYAAAAKEVDRIETLRGVRKDAMGGPGRDVVTDALTIKGGFGNSVRKNADKLRAELSSDQFKQLMNIAEDFDRGMATSSPSRR